MQKQAFTTQIHNYYEFRALTGYFTNATMQKRSFI